MNKGNRVTKSISGQMYEDRGFHRVANSRSIYWKIVGGPELCVVRLGQDGYKICEFEVGDIPVDEAERDAWGSEWALTIASDRNFHWHKE